MSPHDQLCLHSHLQSITLVACKFFFFFLGGGGGGGGEAPVVWEGSWALWGGGGGGGEASPVLPTLDETLITLPQPT